MIIEKKQNLYVKAINKSIMVAQKCKKDLAEISCIFE